MAEYDEETLADLLRTLPAPPQAWVQAAQEIPLARRGLDDIVERARADQAFRDALIADLERAAEIPLQIAEAGSDLASLAALLVEHGNPEVRADAAVASLLAEGGTRAAAMLVKINLGATEDDPRVRHAQLLAQVAAESAQR